MADLSSVLATITQNLVAPIYPNGLSSPSIAGVQVTIESGWPIRNQLDKDLQSGFAHVSVYPTDMERDVTKFQRNDESLTLTPPTITLTVSGNNVTVGGTIQTPQAAMLVVDGVGYSYQIQGLDTLTTIAENLAALIPGATTTGTVINLVGVHSIIARIATKYTASQELARFERVLMISVWAPTPAIRAALESAINVYMLQNYRITLADGFYAQVFYKGMPWRDMLEKSLIYRSDLMYTVQYPTTVTNDYTSIEFPFINSTTFN